MDSNIIRQDGRIIVVVDDEWQKDKLPAEDIIVPAAELPDPDADNGNSQETVKEHSQKWTELALNRIKPEAVSSSHIQ